MAKRVPAPDRIAHLNLLDRVDYTDAFAATLDAAQRGDRTPADLVDLAFGRAPGWLRALNRTAQRSLLRLHLDPATAPGRLPGWQQLRSDADLAVSGATGPLMTIRVTVAPDPVGVVLVTQLRYNHRLARPLWWFVGLVHRRIVSSLLSRGARLAAADGAGRMST